MGDLLAVSSRGVPGVVAVLLRPGDHVADASFLSFPL
jgi:hypothetical protein